jgi:hypothetical protein
LINRRLSLRSQLCAAIALHAADLPAIGVLNCVQPLDREHKRLADWEPTMKLTFTHNGRETSMEGMLEAMQRDAIDMGMKAYEERVRGIASSIVDPETGKHADVFVRRTGETTMVLKTSGSPAFAAELERRLGLNEGDVEVDKAGSGKPLLVYLAHGSEDKETIVRPLARRLMEKGIEVWLDEWEIRAGDSLRQKMEEGLGDCTHFVVVLTPTSMTKPWVNAEIDAAFVRRVSGVSKLIPLRCGVEMSSLSPFLAAILSLAGC